jgi:hypothetical protein
MMLVYLLSCLMILLTGCATKPSYKYKIPLCEEPALEGGDAPKYIDLYIYAQDAQAAIEKCNQQIESLNG